MVFGEEPYKMKACFMPPHPGQFAVATHSENDISVENEVLELSGSEIEYEAIVETGSNAVERQLVSLEMFMFTLDGCIEHAVVSITTDAEPKMEISVVDLILSVRDGFEEIWMVCGLRDGMEGVRESTGISLVAGRERPDEKKTG